MVLIGSIIGILYIIIAGMNDYVIEPAKNKKEMAHLHITKSYFKYHKSQVKTYLGDKFDHEKNSDIPDEEFDKMCHEIAKHTVYRLAEYYDKYGYEKYSDLMQKRGWWYMFVPGHDFDTEMFTEKPNPDYPIDEMIIKCINTSKIKRRFNNKELELIWLKCALFLSDNIEDIDTATYDYLVKLREKDNKLED